MLCTTDLEQRGPKTDHVPILTRIDLDIPPVLDADFKNYKEVDWESFNTFLSNLLTRLPLTPIETEEQFQETARALNLALRETVENCVPKTRPSPHSRHWWNKDLTKMKKEVNRLNRIAYQFRALPDHPSHGASKTTKNRFCRQDFQSQEGTLVQLAGRDIRRRPLDGPQVHQ